MKICLISPNFPPARCGVGDYTCHLARELARQGWEVAVITARKPGLTPLQDDKVEVLPVIERWDFSAIRQMVNLSKQRQFDVVNFQYVPNAYNKYAIPFPICFLPIALRAFSPARVVVTLHELYYSRSWRLKTALVGWLQRSGLIVLVLGSHKLIVTTKDRYCRLQELFPWKKKDLALIPVGSNIPVMSVADEEKEELRRAIGIREGTLVLVLFGLVNPGKQVSMALQALKNLADKGHDVRLICLGSMGEQVLRSMDGMDATLQEKVIVPGYLSADQVSRYFSISDIYLLPLADGASTRRTTLFSAMAHGLAIVTTLGQSTDVEFLTNDFLKLVPANDERAFVDAVQELAENPSLRQRLGHNAQAFYQTHLAWNCIAEQLIEVLGKIAPSYAYYH